MNFAFGLVADFATGRFWAFCLNPFGASARPRPPGNRLIPCPPGLRPSSFTCISRSPGALGPALLVDLGSFKTARATMVMERRDGLACSV